MSLNNNGGQEIVWRYRTPLNSGWLVKNLIGAVDEGIIEFPSNFGFDSVGDLYVGPMSFYYRSRSGGRPGIFKVTTTENFSVRISSSGDSRVVGIGYNYDFTLDEETYGNFVPIYDSRSLPGDLTAADFDGLVICLIFYNDDGSPVISFDGVKRSESRYLLDGVSAEPRLAIQLPYKDDVSGTGGFSNFRFLLKRFNEKLETYNTTVYDSGADILRSVSYSVSNGWELPYLEVGKFYSVGYKASVSSFTEDNPIGVISFTGSDGIVNCFDSLEDALGVVAYPSNKVAYVLLGVVRNTGVGIEVYNPSSSVLNSVWAIKEARSFFAKNQAPTNSVADIPTLYNSPDFNPVVHKDDDAIYSVVANMKGYKGDGAIQGGSLDQVYDSASTAFDGNSGKAWKRSGDTGYSFYVDAATTLSPEYFSTVMGSGSWVINPNIMGQLWSYLAGAKRDGSDWGSFTNWPSDTGLRSGNVTGSLRELYQHILCRSGFMTLDFGDSLKDNNKPVAVSGRVDINNKLCFFNSLNQIFENFSPGQDHFLYAFPTNDPLKDVTYPSVGSTNSFSWPSFDLRWGTTKPEWDATLNGWYRKGYNFENSYTSVPFARAVMQAYVVSATDIRRKVLLDSYNAFDKYLTGYPVGSLYMSLDSTDPRISLGGMWEPIGQGRAPVGIGSFKDVRGETRDFKVGEVGGEFGHILSIPELAAHSHVVTGYSYRDRYLCCSGSCSAVTFYGGGAVTDTVGGNSPHNNMQPYFTCYMWQRKS